MLKPDLTTVPPFYHNYIQQVQADKLQEALQFHLHDVSAFLDAIAADKWDHRYAPDKWSIKEMVQHIIDTERIFCYRALCIARQEKASLPGFDENAYAAASKADKRQKEDLLAEFSTVQQASWQLFQSFDEADLAQAGIANNSPITANAIGFILVGHAQHHKRILRERYL